VMKYAKNVNINNHAWVDSLHLESEIPGFYTRYLATVKSDIGVLVTYSINKSKYQQYLEDFDNMVKTLKVFRKPGMGLNANPQNSNLFDATKVPVTMSETTVFPNSQIQGGSDQKPVRKKSLPLLPILIGGAAVGYLIWRKKQTG